MNLKVLATLAFVALISAAVFANASQAFASTTSKYTDKYGITLDFPSHLVKRRWSGTLDLISSSSFTTSTAAEGETEISVSIFDNAKQLSVSDWANAHAPDNKLQLLPFGENIENSVLSSDTALIKYQLPGHNVIRYAFFEGNKVYTVMYIYSEDTSLSTSLLSMLQSFSFNKTKPFAKVSDIQAQPVATREMVGTSASTQASQSSLSFKLPWAGSVSHVMTQGWGGATSHGSGFLWYAYDFDLNGGEKVVASAAGTVSYVDGHFTECGDGNYAGSANYVVVSHSDGTATQYLHLSSVSVSVGQAMSQGQEVGKAGHIGWTYCDDQLHFQRESQGGVWTQSQSIYFDEYSGQQLSAGTPYTSGNYGQLLDYNKYLLLPGDYDMDRKKDPAHFDPVSRVWHMRLSNSGWAESTVSLNMFANVIPVGGCDFDGDKKTDPTVFDPASGYWQSRLSLTGVTYVMSSFGGPSTIPVGGIYYDNDQYTDRAQFSKANGHLYIIQTSNNVKVDIPLSTNGNVIPIAGYYDADSKMDLGYYDPATGYWNIKLSTTGSTWRPLYGSPGAVAIPGSDYNNDTKTDIAYYEPASGMWHVAFSNSNVKKDFQMGWASAIPVPGMNYDNISQSKLAIFDRATGTWYLRPNYNVTNNDWAFGFGNSGSIPL